MAMIRCPSLRPSLTCSPVYEALYWKGWDELKQGSPVVSRKKLLDFQPCSTASQECPPVTWHCKLKPHDTLSEEPGTRWWEWRLLLHTYIQEGHCRMLEHMFHLLVPVFWSKKEHNIQELQGTKGIPLLMKGITVMSKLACTSNNHRSDLICICNDM